MRILMLVSNAFTADPRVYAEARSLIKTGHDVMVIAWDREKLNPRRQNWDGIEVVRLRTCLALRYGLASWLWNGINLLLWWRRACRRAVLLKRETPFGVIHCHDLDTLAIGVRLKRKLRIPLVYDAHEVYAYMASRSLPRWLVRFIFWLEKRLLRYADRVINVGEAQSRYFGSITDTPVIIIMNCKPLQGLQYRPPENAEFTVLYIGGLSKVRAITMLVRAAKGVPGVSCLIGGIGRPDYVQALKEECSATANVAFLGRVPFAEVIPMTAEADAVFCMFDPTDPNNIIGTPNKLFEAMACGRPIICTRGTYSGDLTEQEDVGLAVEYNEQALRDAIIKLRDDPALRERLGRNALAAAIGEYNWETDGNRLVDLYANLRREAYGRDTLLVPRSRTVGDQPTAQAYLWIAWVSKEKDSYIMRNPRASAAAPYRERGVSR